MLDWSMADLAKAARLSLSTVQRFERGPPAAVSREVHLSILGAFETAGVLFLNDDGDGYGLRLRSAGSGGAGP